MNAWIFGLFRWTLTSMTFVAAALFLTGFIDNALRLHSGPKSVRRRWFPLTWLTAAAAVSALQVVCLPLAALFGRLGDWAKAPLIFGLGGVLLSGAMAVAILIRGEIDDIPPLQMTIQMIVLTLACGIPFVVVAYLVHAIG
jgi:hypothetical protein